MRRVFRYQKKSILSIIFQKNKEKNYNTTTTFFSWNWITIIPALRISTSCPNFFTYIQGKKLVKFNFMKCFDNILYNNLTNHTNNAMFFCQKKKYWKILISDFFFTFFFFDFFLSFPFSGVESNEATDPGCEVEGESSFFGFNKYNMI